ncbi:MBL fold metallo-hydrolase [Aquamicrobium segne]|uniref:MBL fold metallo-hydrolase n=1 Tax=Aquamicrobium segne TaxID=469547 RepID=A0ABW0GXT9_9HYPH
MIRAKAVSGLGGKAPACFLIETGQARFLLDLGEGAPGQFPDLSGIGTVDAILISHGHADHIGGLHLADQVGNPPIYATAMTKAFAGHPKLAEALILPLQGQVEIAGVIVETGRAGHAAGGIWMRISGEEGVLYSGDFCRESLLYPVDTPLAAKTLIVDASYGAYDTDITDAISTLIDAARKGPLLLPLPPTGRGVEIAVLLHEAGCPVFICDQHHRSAELMLAGDAATLVEGGRDRLGHMLSHAGRLDAKSDAQGAMIAANGATTAGLSKTLMARFANKNNVQILITGHVEAGSPAKAAIEKGRAGFLRWNVHPHLHDLVWLHKLVRPQTTLYAFCDDDTADAVRAFLVFTKNG